MSDPTDSAMSDAADDAAIPNAEQLSVDPAFAPAADDAAMLNAGQLPFPGLAGQTSRRANGHVERRHSGDGLTGHAAFDYGGHMWVSTDGNPDNSYRLLTPRRTLCTDVVECISILFHAHRCVVTEAPTTGSFGMRGRLPAVLALLKQYPDRTLYTIGARSVQNELRRQPDVEYNSATDDYLAAATIWTLAARHRPKIWRPPNPDERPTRYDPVRPHVGDLVQMRSDGYPDARWYRDITPYLPSIADVTSDQRLILCNRNGTGWDHARDRCSALIWSLCEPLAVSRSGWERIIGASSHGRPNLYRQMLVVGNRRRDYQHGFHFTGLTRTAATRALRQLRTMVLPTLAQTGRHNDST